MKILSVIGLAIIIFAHTGMFSLRAMSKTEAKKEEGMAMGLIDGKLAACEEPPNCVCSEIESDKKHYIAPIVIPANSDMDNFAIIKNIISDMGGVIKTENGDYLAAEFTSKVFKFVDDLEIRMAPSQQLIHIRSSSRVGYSDFHVNKKRVEAIRDKYISITQGDDK